MKNLREDEIDELEALSNLINYVIRKKNIEPNILFYAVEKFNEASKKYVVTKIITDQEFDEFIDPDDIKELIEKIAYNVSYQCFLYH